MATMEEIAEKAGVSQATVSRVINGHSGVSERKRKLVLEWARKLDYQPNRTAQSLKNNKSNLIGLIVSDISNPYFAEIVHAVEKEAANNGYNIILCNTESNLQKERESINTLRSRQVEGILIVPSDKLAPHLKTIKKLDIPFVVITQFSDLFASVAVDHAKGGEMIVRHLADLGHTKIGYIGPLKYAGYSEDKFEGYKNGLKKSNLEFNLEYVIETEGGAPELSSQDVFKKVNQFLKQKDRSLATAYFAYNDLAAFEAIKAFEDHNLKIPEDIAIAGFDNTSLAQINRPGLTTISQPIKTIGHVGLDMLFDKIKENKEDEKIILEPQLIVRESTLKYRRS
ncbi:MAG: LacI family DNA-binding transcriptional regulator [Bacillota bacterium]